MVRDEDRSSLKAGLRTVFTRDLGLHMMTAMKWSTLTILLVLVLAAPCFAWSTKEHILLTRCAVREIMNDPAAPKELKQFLAEAQPAVGSIADEQEFLLHKRIGQVPRGVDGLAFWATVPDMVADAAAAKDKAVAPFGVPEGQLHFLDLELLNADAKLQTFAADLSHKPRLGDIPRKMDDPRYIKAGFLPFRIEDCYRKMIVDMRAGRLVDKPGEYPRDEHATKWAGYLAHYAADNLMPMHATVDYQAYSFFPGLAKPPKVHFDMEFRLVDDEEADYEALREQFWTIFVKELADAQRPSDEHDVWLASVQIALQSYDALPMIGQAARGAYLRPDGKLKAFDATAFFSYRGQYEGQEVSVMQLKARQMARAVRWIEHLWVQGWQEAHANGGGK